MPNNLPDTGDNAQPSSTESNPKTPDLLNITHNNNYKENDDPPMIDVKITNPVTYLKLWFKKLFSNEGIDISFKVKPITAVLIVLAITTIVGGTSLSLAKWYFFPILVPTHMIAKTSYTGKLQSSGEKFILVTTSSQAYILKNDSPQNLSQLKDQNVLVTGKLNNKTNIIEVSEIASLNTTPSPQPTLQPIPTLIPTTHDTIIIPNVYTGFIWETNQKKTILFTSGKKRINVEGTRLESITLKEYPTEFMNYYAQQLTANSWKQTLNSTSPDENIISFERDGSYLTAGIEILTKVKMKTELSQDIRLI